MLAAAATQGTFSLAVWGFGTGPSLWLLSLSGVARMMLPRHNQKKEKKSAQETQAAVLSHHQRQWIGRGEDTGGNSRELSDARWECSRTRSVEALYGWDGGHEITCTHKIDYTSKLYAKLCFLYIYI